MKIEIEIPTGIDFNHALDSISDALYFSQNVTREEYDFVFNLIQTIQLKQTNK